MACIEHTCPRCPFATFDNLPDTPTACPDCGAELAHLFDEDPSDLDSESEAD